MLLRQEIAGGRVTYDQMDAFELRAEREEWHEKVCKLAREYRQARRSSDFAWEAGVGIALDQALAQVKRLDALLKLGAAS